GAVSPAGQPVPAPDMPRAASAPQPVPMAPPPVASAPAPRPPELAAPRATDAGSANPSARVAAIPPAALHSPAPGLPAPGAGSPAASTAPAPATRPSAAPRMAAATRITRLAAVAGTPDTQVRVQADGRLGYRSFVLSGPTRVVVDFEGVAYRLTE